MKSRLPPWANLARGPVGDLEWQRDVGLQVATCRFEVELRQRSVVGTGARDQNVVDRPGQLVEELPQALEISGVEGGDAGPELELHVDASISGGITTLLILQTYHLFPPIRSSSADAVKVAAFFLTSSCRRSGPCPLA